MIGNGDKDTDMARFLLSFLKVGSILIKTGILPGLHQNCSSYQVSTELPKDFFGFKK